jgi:hypothetical protein
LIVFLNLDGIGVFGQCGNELVGKHHLDHRGILEHMEIAYFITLRNPVRSLLTSINETDLEADLNTPKTGKRAIDAKIISRRYMPGCRGLSACAAETRVKKIRLLSRSTPKHRPMHGSAVFIVSF